MRVIDLHEDLAFTSQTTDVRDDSKQSNIKGLAELGDATVFSVLFPHVGTWNERSDLLSEKYGGKYPSTAPLFHVLMEQIKLYHYFERAKLGTIVRNSSDLDANGVKFLIALEGLDALTDPYDVYMLGDLGMRSMGLCWNYDNKFAASCMSKKDYGLTGSGLEAIEICNEIGIVVDGAHASKNTIIEAAEASSKPILVSHTNAKGVHNHARNLDDETIEAVIKKKGTIGVTAIRATLSDDPTIDDLVKHATYIGENFGWDYVSLGTDFLGIPDTPKGFENLSKLNDLAEKLGKHAEDVFWKNAYRVLKANL